MHLAGRTTFANGGHPYCSRPGQLQLAGKQLTALGWAVAGGGLAGAFAIGGQAKCR